jgi:alanyl-tRNA synthetase
VTVYAEDDEAADIWLNEVGVEPSRVVRIATTDNFWQMGDTGPCGPCSEIFYDHGPDVQAARPVLPDADGDRYIEIWNLVFMQYNRDNAGTLHPLPKPSVDTGMGLERISAVMQQVHSNYDIDLFQSLIQSGCTGNPHGNLADNSLKSHCRSYSRLFISDHRWCHSRQRRPRLCIATHHPPRHSSWLSNWDKNSRSFINW